MSVSTEDALEELLIRVAGGDEDAWQQFFDRYAGIIYVRCCDFDLTPHIAEDIVVDVMIKLHKKLKEFEFPAGVQEKDHAKVFSGWLRNVTSNSIIDFLRKQKKGAQEISPEAVSYTHLTLPTKA